MLDARFKPAPGAGNKLCAHAAMSQDAGRQTPAGPQPRTDTAGRAANTFHTNMSEGPKPTWLEECAQEANALTREKRQEFIDLIWEGNTLGAARDKAGISFNAANGVMRMNISSMDYLQRESA